MIEPTVRNTGELRAVLERITWAPSCVDMHWEWTTEEVGGWAGGPSGNELRAGWLVATTFQRPDTNTGEFARGTGRRWFIEQGSSVSAVVKTAFAAAKMILEHELMEAMLFDGVRLFDPHNSVEALASISGRRE